MATTQENCSYVKYNEDGELLDEANKTLYDTLDLEFGPKKIATGAVSTPEIARHFVSSFNKIPKFDTKADAVQLIVDHITSIKKPYYVAYVLGTNFPKFLHDRFAIHMDVPFEENPVDNMYLDGYTWAKKIFDSIPQYAINCASHTYTLHDRTAAWYKLQVCCHTKGKEDRMICLPSLELHKTGDSPDCGLFAVLDGHGGHGVAQYAAGHLPYQMVTALEKHQGNTGEALKEALEIIDKRSVLRCKKEKWDDTGSTVVVAAVDGKNVHLRWLGNSLAYVMDASEMVQLTREHTLKDRTEADRIVDAGGKLIETNGEPRVHGTFTATRALGDIAYSEISKESEEIIFERSTDRYLLMLVSNGISNVLDKEKLYEMVKDYTVLNNHDEYSEMAFEIVEEARKKGGNVEDCTCVIVFLREPKDLWKVFDDSSECNTSQDSSCDD